MSVPIIGRRLRTAAALAAGAALVLSAASMSAAADPTIDPTRTASLTVHKYEQPTTATGLDHDGRQLPADAVAGLTPLAGVQFTVQQVPGVDLTTNAGWEKAHTMTAAEAASAVASAPRTTGTTAADGTYRFADLPLGLYYVSETATPTGITPAAPFLVTLPLTDPADNTVWLYDVHVYPKNFAAHTGKTIDDSGVTKVGDSLTWTITSAIPVDGTDGFQITDTLDKRLGYSAVAVSVGSTVLTPTTDYTVTTKVGPTTGRTTVTVALTAAGLVTANANRGAVIRFDLVTTVMQVGTIANVAEVYNNQNAITNKTPSDYTPGHPDGDNPGTVIPDDDYDPTPDLDGPDLPVTKFGGAVLSKVDAGDAAKALAGATFQVFTSEADAKAGTDPVTIGDVSSWTSGADGKVVISGLRYSNWQNGAELTDRSTWQHYWLLETASPAGYERLATPVQFDVIGNDAAVIDLTVKNSLSNGGFSLPLTGGSGLAFLMIGGTTLLVGAVLIGARRRRATVAA